MRIDEQPRPRWTDEQPRTRWVDQVGFRSRRPDLRLGARSHRLDRSVAPVDRIVVRHTVRTATAEYTLLLNAPDRQGRRGVGEALADAVGELRAIDLTYGPTRPGSLVSRLRRGEISPESYPPLADLVDRCAAMRAATDGWFDAWAVPGGFDPGGLLGGWAVERAAARLRAAGIDDYAVLTGPTSWYAATPRTAARGASPCTTPPTLAGPRWCWR
ncbi:thiamine biosynthesis lipoprotein [Micromonospora olivasterospora]|uniref:Thiamine biosynthesis lipoprotein n=1 Tax=Micromonospora olivasterospora TaxID=1880 RepID=A0A562ICP2_MICOL|nr:thiamine biosynthesis lipoprotein [Micromonospora olivasterospora]